MGEVASEQKKTGQRLLTIISFLSAMPLAAMLLLHPALLLDDQGHYSHSAIMLIMIGISGGFIYGVGFIPRFWLWKWLFHPIVSFPLMLWGYYTWLFT